MFKKTALLLTAVLLSGCASANGPYVNATTAVKNYTPSNQFSKTELDNDLRSGKITIGADLDRIRSTYGDADEMFVSEGTVRINYKLNSGKNIILLFEDGRRLSMWKN